jgi:hypothetical protein
LDKRINQWILMPLLSGLVSWRLQLSLRQMIYPMKTTVMGILLMVMAGQSGAIGVN